ncbi:RNA polymerase sigma factor [Tenacibaculum sp. M341]|uniref:RNA polymerase sigma factor n=1 Tax=Tenacibaculum sp. M341 TaxID=2530339 RepID=UPI001043AC79|nr:sigma-70 family RNA polymerase sigma factor [Tenacibaculum sp. M341]TCI91831.1 sigma-70 family RNA polymerase sigma factor [Tenacibaculum sp. M341]
MEDFYLNALVKGDSKTIKKIYTTNFFQVKRFVLQNKGKSEDAEDIFQKAILQIAIRHKKEKIKISTNFDAYLFTVCKNLWRRELNNYKKRVTNSEVVEQKDESTDNALAIVEQKRQELFIEKLGEISDNCKQILTLFFAKTTYAEIVEQTEYNSESVVRQRVFKCKKQLTNLIQKDKRYNSLKAI